MVALALDPVQGALVAIHDGLLLRLVETLAPALAVRVLSVHLLLEEGAHHRVLVRGRRTPEARRTTPRDRPRRARRGRRREASKDPETAIARARPSASRPSHHSTPDAASEGWCDFCALETFEEPESRPSRTEWTKSASGKIISSPRAEAIVKQLISTRPGLPVAQRAQEVEEESPAGGNHLGTGAVLDSGGGVLEAPRRRLEHVLVDDLVEATLLALATRAPPRPYEGLFADSNAMPPVAPELGQKRRRRRLTRHDLGKALRVRVEAALDRDRVKGRVVADQLGDDVRAAPAGAADEDEG